MRAVKGETAGALLWFGRTQEYFHGLRVRRVHVQVRAEHLGGSFPKEADEAHQLELAEGAGLP